MKKRPRRPKKKKLTKSQVLSIRLDPQVKYLAELISRKERRSLSNYIEWAVERSVEMSDMKVQEIEDRPKLWEVKSLIWDIDEVNRFVKLKKYFPELLTYDEQAIWKIIEERPYFWKQPVDPEMDIEGALETINLKAQWDQIKMVASGEMDEDELEDLPIVEHSSQSKPTNTDIDENDIPIS